MSRWKLRLDLRNLAWQLINRPPATANPTAELMTVIRLVESKIEALEDAAEEEAVCELRKLIREVHDGIDIGQEDLSENQLRNLIGEIGRRLYRLADRLR